MGRREVKRGRKEEQGTSVLREGLDNEGSKGETDRSGKSWSRPQRAVGIKDLGEELEENGPDRDCAPWVGCQLSLSPKEACQEHCPQRKHVRSTVPSKGTAHGGAGVGAQDHGG